MNIGTKHGQMQVNILQSQAEIMGFQSIRDFGTTVTGYIFFKSIFLMSVFFGAVFFCAEQSSKFISKWVHDPAPMMISIWAMIFIDWLSQVYPAAVAGKFQTNKAKRLIPILIANTLLLSLLFWCEKQIIISLESETLTYSFRVFRLWCGAYVFGVSFLSAVSNAGRNGLVKMQVVDFVTKYVDAQKKKYDKKIE